MERQAPVTEVSKTMNSTTPLVASSQKARKPVAPR